MCDGYRYDMVADSKRISEYDQEMQQSHTTDQPMAPRGGIA